LTLAAANLVSAAVSQAPEPVRLDKWLWSVRVHRSRALATDACRAGSVMVNDIVAKPAREVRPGETVQVKMGLITRTLRVVGAPRSRVGAKLVADYCTDLTPPEEWAKARAHTVQQVLAREKGSGRPTKRDRRLLDELFG
jgi:ribosome-associated heat shock protein Hsp15